MNRNKAVLLIIMVLFLSIGGCMVDQNSKQLWQVLEDMQYSSYAPRLRFLTKKYGDIFEMDVYGQITSTLPEYQGLSFEVEFNTETLQYEENFLVQYRREEIEAFLQEKISPVIGNCKIYVGGTRSSLPKDAAVEDILKNEKFIVKPVICIPFSDDYQSHAFELIEELSNQGYMFSTIEILFFDSTQYDKVGRDWVIPRLRGAGSSVDDEDYAFNYRLAVWFNFSSREYVMNWR